MGPKANKNTHTDWVSHILHLIVHIQEHTKQHEQICHQQQSHMHGLHVQQLTNIRFVLNKHGRKYTHMHSAAEKAKRHNSLWSCPVCLQVSQLKVESRRGHAQTYTNNHTCIHTYHAYTHISHFLFQREEQPHTCTNTQCSGYFAATRIEAELSLRTFKDAKSKTMCLAGDCGKKSTLKHILKKTRFIHY